MNIQEAYDKTMAIISEIDALGVEVTKSSSRSRENPDIVAKYYHVDRLPPEQWYHVSFHIFSDAAAKLVFIRLKELDSLGITFDTGGSQGQRDWEIDWSFVCNQFQDSQRDEALDIVDDILTKMGAENDVH